MSAFLVALYRENNIVRNKCPKIKAAVSFIIKMNVQGGPVHSTVFLYKNIRSDIPLE